MCGIAGIVSKHYPIDRDIIGAMCDSIAHRGPDSSGLELLNDNLVALGHRRLEIIDLSELGSQPMSDQSGNIWITYNGEIYNFQTLRNELEKKGYIFRSNSDTEVIIYAYKEWGYNCVKKFRGIFAFGIWDNAKKILFLARDHFGVKPLYYFSDKNQFLFATELKAIMINNKVNKKLSMSSLMDYLTYGYVPFDKSIFSGCFKLPAAHYLIFDGQNYEVNKYWSLDYTGEIKDEIEAVSYVRTLLEDSISSQLVSDVPKGIFLSGGIDSSSVYAIANNIEPNIPAYTIGFDEEMVDESRYAKMVSSFLGNEQYLNNFSLENALEGLTIFSSIYDEPFYDGSGLPTYLLSRYTSKNVKVAIGGDGGDEVFAGYPWYDHLYQEYNTDDYQKMFLTGLYPLAKKMRLNSQKMSNLYYSKKHSLNIRDPLAMISHFMTRMARGNISRLINPKLYDINDYDYNWLFKKFWLEDLPIVTRAQLLDINTYLVDDILVKVDRASMANGLEVRVPLLDHKLVEGIFKISNTNVYKGRKYLFKKAVSDILPSRILSNRKKGFGIPYKDWFNKKLYRVSHDLLSDGSLAGRGLINIDNLNVFIEKKDFKSVWQTLILEIWARKWLDGENIKIK